MLYKLRYSDESQHPPNYQHIWIVYRIHLHITTTYLQESNYSINFLLIKSYRENNDLPLAVWGSMLLRNLNKVPLLINYLFWLIFVITSSFNSNKSTTYIVRNNMWNNKISMPPSNNWLCNIVLKFFYVWKKPKI